MKFECAHCKQPLEAPMDLEGQAINCPSCNVALLIPHAPKTPLVNYWPGAVMAVVVLVLVVGIRHFTPEEQDDRNPYLAQLSSIVRQQEIDAPVYQQLLNDATVAATMASRQRNDPEGYKAMLDAMTPEQRVGFEKQLKNGARYQAPPPLQEQEQMARVEYEKKKFEEGVINSMTPDERRAVIDRQDLLKRGLTQ